MLISARTGNISLGVGGKGNLWNKVKGENFFAGGKTFQALPPSINPQCNKNAKLNLIANSNAKSTVKEMIKNPGIKISSGIKTSEQPENPSAMVQSNKHGGRLLAAALGQHSQNLSLKTSHRLKVGEIFIKFDIVSYLAIRTSYIWTKRQKYDSSYFTE